MLSERPRNILVGLTMILALGVLMWGIILLGKFPTFGGLRPYDVTLLTPNANGVTSGSAVMFKGVYVGQVKSVDLTGEVAGVGGGAGGGKITAKVVVVIDHRYKIPGNAVATLTKPQTVGNPFVDIEVMDVPGPPLPQDGSARLEAIAAEGGLIPKKVFEDLSALTQRLSTVADDLHMMLAYAPPEALDGANPNDPNRLRENATTVIVRLNRTIKSLQDLLTDPVLQGNVRLAVQNIAEASAQLKTTLQKIEGIAENADKTVGAIGTAATQVSVTFQATQKEISQVSQKLVEMLNTLQTSTKLLVEGNGTTGRLINDPRLYENLLGLSQSLKTTADNLNVLIDKWKDEGVNLHLGK